jgi:flagellar hook-associated protein 1 FlgK
MSAILTNSAALKVTADNIANVNTPGYNRRIVELATQTAGSQTGGVTISDIQRVTNQFLTQATSSATSQSSYYSTQSSILDEFNSALGSPGDGSSIMSQLDNVYSSLGSLSLDPTSLASQQAVIGNLQSTAQSISGLATSVQQLRQSADTQVGSTVDQINPLLKQIYQLNLEVEQAKASGDNASAALDQRDQAVSQLASLVDVQTAEQPDGRITVSTNDGTRLVGDTYAQLTYNPAGSDTFGPVTIQQVQPADGSPLGTAQSFNEHVASGQLGALLEVRDGDLADIGTQLGSLAQTLGNAFNAVSNASTLAPPPSTLSGRNTGLLSTDALNFTGKTNIGITDSNGNLLHKVAVDFGAGTLSVDGGSAVAFGNSVGAFSTALNAALGGNGTASFSNGTLTLSASGGNGIVVSDDGTAPSSRGGAGFSQFFGLNDVFQSSANLITATGLSAGDTANFAPGGTIGLALKNSDGSIVKQATVPVTGTTIGDMVGALNSAFSGYASFTLDSTGTLSMTPVAKYSGAALNVTGDTTSRGGTGTSFSQLFGLGLGQTLDIAQGFSLTATAANALPTAQAALSAATPLGARVVSAGDNSGALALQNLSSQNLSFAAAGGLRASTTTAANYLSSMYQDVGTRQATADNNATSAQSKMTAVQAQMSSTDGVNLDEELSNMVTFQQAYNAGARLIQVVENLYDELLSVAGN